MARYKGKDGAVQTGGTDVGEVESFDITLSTNEMDANVIGSDWTDVEGGQMSASGTINVLQDSSDAQQATLVQGDTVTLNLFPEGNTTGLIEISGSFLVTERSMTVSAGDIVKTSITVRNKGTVTVGTVV